MDPIQILIADDQTITRSGIRSLLVSQPVIEIVGEARNGAEAIELAAAHQPDVILWEKSTMKPDNLLSWIRT